MPTFLKVEALGIHSSHSLILSSYQTNFGGWRQGHSFPVIFFLRLIPNTLDLTGL